MSLCKDWWLANDGFKGKHAASHFLKNICLPTNHFGTFQCSDSTATSAAVSTPCRWHQTIIPSGKRGVSLGQALVCAHNRTPMVSASTLSLSEKVEKQKMSKKYQKIIPNQFLEGFFIVLRVSMCLLQSSSNAPLTAGNMGGTWREISAAEVGTLLEFSNCLWLQNCSPEAAFCWFCFCQMSSKSR